MATPPPAPKRPYLLRALHEWMTDIGQTPHLVVDSAFPGVEVPQQYAKDGRIVLNISYAATSSLHLGNEEIAFDGRFGGNRQRVRVPMRAVLGIYARETGEGLVFTPDEYGGGANEPGPPPPGPEPVPPVRPSLKVVK